MNVDLDGAVIETLGGNIVVAGKLFRVAVPLALVCLLQGCAITDWIIAKDAEAICNEIVRRYVDSGTIPTESEGIVYGLVKRGVRPEWFLKLGGRIEGDPSAPGANYLREDGGIIAYVCDARHPSFQLEYKYRDPRPSKVLVVSGFVAFKDGGDEAETCFTSRDLPYLYRDAKGRVSINLIAQKGKVPLDPRTGRMLDDKAGVGH